jgi:hypothetical protein
VKKFLLVCALASLPIQVSLGDNQKPDPCEMLDGVAEAAMLSRQAGMPMIDMYRNADKAGPGVAKVAKMVIAEAYKVPRYPGEREQKAAVTDFRDHFFKACISQEKPPAQ